MRDSSNVTSGRARVLADDEREPVPGLIWLVGGATLLWAVSYIIRLVA